MVDQFKHRSSDLELMDLPIVKKEELFTNLKELIQINKMTGGPSLGFYGIQQLLKYNRPDQQEIHIVDIGFGAGDMLNYLSEHIDKFPVRIKLTGIDIMPEAFDFVKQQYPDLVNKVNFVRADYKDWFTQGNRPDIVVASLFCHHLDMTEMDDFLSFIRTHVKIGAVINDLERSRIAYYGIMILTRLFSKSRFTKNDAPLSVLRGFTSLEWKDLMSKNKIFNFSLKWKWAFRHLIIIKSS